VDLHLERRLISSGVEFESRRQWKGLVPLPKQIEKCHPTLLKCTVPSRIYTRTKFITELLLRGYADAVFKLGCQPIGPFPVATCIQIRQAIPPSCDLGSKPAEAAMQLSERKHHLTSVPVRSIPEPTIHRVQIPHFRRGRSNTQVEVTNDVVILSMPPNRVITQTRIRIPSKIQTLEACTVIMENSGKNLTPKVLVEELLVFGCGKKNFRSYYLASGRPWILPCGAEITVSVPVRSPLPFCEESYAVLDYNWQLILMEERFKCRIYGAQHSDVKVNAKSTRTPSGSSHSVKVPNSSGLSGFNSEDSPASKYVIRSTSNAPAAPLQNMDQPPISSHTSPVTSDSPGNPVDFMPSIGYSPKSNFVSPASFTSAGSPTSFMTAKSAYTSPASVTVDELSPVSRIEILQNDEPLDASISEPLQKLQNDYYKHLYQCNIVQPLDKELNWSGKGQHVTFSPKDTVPLRALSHLGASTTAHVEKVLCRRIALARKTMTCSRQWTMLDALREVYHLQNLRHHHIVQLVGSYLQGRKFSILMYPVAEWDLGTFIDNTADCLVTDEMENDRRRGFLVSALNCLTSAVAHVHEHTTKHMDIKPKNILVREVQTENRDWCVYLTDFGISRSFASQDHSQSDGPTFRTLRYCAPEVYNYDQHGRSADIFSLGCVFLEILTVYIGKHPQDFSEFRRGSGIEDSFYATLPRVAGWINLHFTEDHVSPRITLLVKTMIHMDPKNRPTAAEIQNHEYFRPRDCCAKPPEPYVAYKEPGSTPLPCAKEAPVKSFGPSPCVRSEEPYLRLHGLEDEDARRGKDSKERTRVKPRRVSGKASATKLASKRKLGASYRWTDGTQSLVYKGEDSPGR
jgi:serine/threonine protein kinase